MLAVKLCLAGSVAVIALASGSPLTTAVRHTMVALIAISMGAQLAVIRYMKVPDLVTVVVTLTITGALTERRSGWDDPKLLRRVLSVIAFAVGAMAGALLILNVSLAAALLFGLVIMVSVAIAAHLVSRAEASWAAPRTP